MSFLSIGLYPRSGPEKNILAMWHMYFEEVTPSLPISCPLFLTFTTMMFPDMGSHNLQVPWAHPQQRDCEVHRLLFYLWDRYKFYQIVLIFLQLSPFESFSSFVCVKTWVQMSSCKDVSGGLFTLEPFSSRFQTQREKLDTWASKWDSHQNGITMGVR